MCATCIVAMSISVVCDVLRTDSSNVNKLVSWRALTLCMSVACNCIVLLCAKRYSLLIVSVLSLSLICKQSLFRLLNYNRL